MTRETKTVTEAQLAALIDAGAILRAFIIEDGDGAFHILARSVKQIDHRIILKRGGFRTFRTIDAAAKLLRQLGISRIELHMNEYAPGNAPLLR
jgi:hypothetical protein